MSNVKSLISITLFLASSALSAETIRIGIGHQSMVPNTVAGGVLLERLKLIEKHLPVTGRYADVDYQVTFRDYDSGPPITNHMMAGNLDFGVMGDYPLIVNGAKFQQTGAQQTRFIAVTGYNARGTGNGIVVPAASTAHSLEDLVGKSLSVPVGSAAWGMTLKALSDAGLSDKIKIVNQSPPVGAANIAAGRIDAHADFCPWSELMEFRGTGRKIFDGSETGVPTFHGIVVREAFSREHPEVVEAVLKATLEAQRWIQEDPARAAEQLGEWTGVDKEVLYLYLSKGGITTTEASIKPQWVDAMKYAHGLLQREIALPDLDFAAWVDDSFIRSAAAQSNLDYGRLVANVVKSEPVLPGLKPAEIWFADGVRGYDSIAEMLEAARVAEAAGQTIHATYVYDHPTGLKLFGKSAYLVRNQDGEILAFLKQRDSQDYLTKHGGEALDHQAWLAQLD